MAVARRACDPRSDESYFEVLRPEQLDDATLFVRVYEHLIGVPIDLPILWLLQSESGAGTSKAIGYRS